MISSRQALTIWGGENTWQWRGMNFHWKMVGEKNKKSILLLHGFGASSEHWRYNADFFADAGFRVYGLDLLGFGKSEQPSKKKIKKLDNKIWSEQVACFLKEVIQKSNAEKTILIGNSLGGLVALTTARFYPNLISAVIAAPLPDPALMQSKPAQLPNLIKRGKDLLVLVFFNLLPLEIFIPLISNSKIIEFGIQFAYHNSINSDQKLKRIIREPAQRTTAARSLRAMCIGMATRNKYFTAPFLLKDLDDNPMKPLLLLIWGREDKLVPLIIGKRLISRYDWLNLIILKETGHCPHDESPEKFNQCVLDWLKINL